MQKRRLTGSRLLSLAWWEQLTTGLMLAVTFTLAGCSGSPGVNGPDGRVLDEADGATELEPDPNVSMPLPNPPTRASDGDSLVWEPIALADLRRLRDGFRWEQTKRLSETSSRSYDVDGEVVALPPMHYALIYVDAPDQLLELEEVGIHYDVAPLFDSEWPDTEQSLTLPFEGDLEDRGGQFVFALIPSPVYNFIQGEAVAGEDAFRAVILREVPEEARAQDGTVSWDYLLATMTEYAPRGTENTDEGELGPEAMDEGEVVDDAETVGAQKRLGRRLRKLARRAARKVKRAVNGVRKVIGKAASLVLRDTTITVKTHVNPRTNVPMTRAWDDGQGGYGKPLMLTGLRVAISGQSRLTLYPGTLNRAGEATIKVPRTLRVNVCFEADSPTARLEMGLFRAVRHCWPKHRPRGNSDTIARAIGETEFYALALMTDAREYADKVLGFKPPKATVQVGRLSSWLSSDDRAFVPCLAATKAPLWLANTYADALNGAAGAASVATGGIIPPIPLGDLVDFGITTDVVLPKGSQRSRNTAVHEYGHFFFCTLLHDQYAHTFSKVWSQVIRLKNLSNTTDSAVRAINEGFADWFASQVSGSVNYFRLESFGGIEEGSLPAFFFGAGASAEGRGLEENVGGPACSFTGGLRLPGCFVSEDRLATAQQRAIATVVTILHDAIDRSACGSDARCRSEKRSDGAVWNPPRASDAPFTPASPFVLHDVADETVALAPRDITRAIRAFADGRLSGQSLSYNTFFGALSGEMKDRRYSDAEICNLFALHRQDGRCPLAWTNTDAAPRVTVTYSTYPNNAGDIQGAGTGATCTASACTLDAGQTLALQAKPRVDYTFTGWSECSNATTDSIQLKNVQSARNCVANFRPITFVVNASATTGGSVTPTSATVNSGDSVTLQATADESHLFSHYSGSTQCTGTSPRLVISPVRSHVACTAHFVRAHQVSYVARDGTRVSAALGSGQACSGSACTVEIGGSVVLRPSTLPGYKMEGWSCTETGSGRRVNSFSSSEPGTLTLSNLQASWSCEATADLILL